MTKTRCTFLIALTAVLCGTVVFTWAAPSLPILKPPVVPLSQMTGPALDPTAAQGQWFKDSSSGEETCRTNEFYDNFHAEWASVNAISGHVSSITYSAGPGTPITAFSIEATIINDTAVEHQEWLYGDNSHGETNFFTDTPYTGTLVDTKLTAEFAVTDLMNLPALWIPPYNDYPPYIEADNEDQAGWYCWNPEDPDMDHVQKGGYFVPTWDFGDILVGQSATRQLDFVIALPGLDPTDTRYAAIVTSEEGQQDVLLNRTTSLKISTWIDELALDTGLPYPHLEPLPPKRSSDASVFHNKEPEEPTLDFGDAPDPAYPTLLVNNGARHTLVAGVMMGPQIDVESDGQPNATATGDDLNPAIGPDDEDGVTFTTSLVLGGTANVDVTVSIAGFLSAWIDFNANGSWTDPGEMIATTLAVTAGVNHVTYSVPTSPAGVAGSTFARFRFTTVQTALAPTGLASDGEVEDYAITITEEQEFLDFGDAWDIPGLPVYPTVLVNNGARHPYMPGMYMGSVIDFEPDGQPTFSADGDDLNPLMSPDDEDGVTLPAILYAGAMTQVVVIANSPGFLDAWIDWNSNSSWADPGEQVFTQMPLNPGANYLPLTVPMPPALVAGGPHSRWRFCSVPTAVPSYMGAYVDGEVEDHEVHLQTIDLGDAPAPYPTLLVDDGARHETQITPTIYLGAVPPDIEPDGLADPNALGDDLNNTDDEDGVIQSGNLILGSNGTLNITASASSILNAWIDFNQDGDWADSGEQIATDSMMIGGGNSVTVPVPLGASPGQTFGRFRLTTAIGTGYTGTASDGEVEDYIFTLYQDGPADTNNLVFTNIVRATTNESQVWWQAETSVVYQVQFTTNLVDPPPVPWTDVGGTIIGPTNDQTDSNAVDRMHFYRIIAPFSPPPP
jgi:GEVED domain